MSGEEARTILLNEILESQREMRLEMKEHIRENTKAHGKLHAAINLVRIDTTVNKTKLAGLVSFIALLMSALGTFISRKFW